MDTQTRESTTQSLNKLLKDVHGKAEANMIETLAIRSMSKAVYTTQNIGHYGLAFNYYSHFTSPIRQISRCNDSSIITTLFRWKKFTKTR